MEIAIRPPVRTKPGQWILGQRRMLLVLEQEASDSVLLVALEDVTACHEADVLLLQQKTLLLEIQHRFANGLQIIATILMLKMRAVDSEETRHHLRDAHQRVVALAAIQPQLREIDAALSALALNGMGTNF